MENIELTGFARNFVIIKNISTKWKEINQAYEEEDLERGIELFNL